ncbi:prepilin-type N-terminal cleavage/methylation domain-containing protein [Patescibacteria group bacterium]|nr:prepilin-type N-terminal cleavage/methylation domain-containing protein [Patescibacteria group bacterium]
MKKQKKRAQIQNESGFTLIELLLSIAIIAVIITAITYFSIDTFKAKAKSSVVLETQQNARHAFQQMTYYIRNSEDGLNVGGSSFAPTDPGTLHLNMGAGAGDDVVFDVNSGRLRITTGGGTPEYLTTDAVTVTSLLFENNSASGTPGNITMSMSLEYDNPSGAQEFNYSYDLQTSTSFRVE